MFCACVGICGTSLCSLPVGIQPLMTEEFLLKSVLRSLRPLLEPFRIVVQQMQLRVDAHTLAGQKSELVRRLGLNSYNAVQLLCIEV